MAKKKRKVPGINGSSSADIAFMLLLFFLLTTSMDTDKGLSRRLPPINTEQQVTDINERNILQIRINSTNDIMCGGEPINLSQLKERAKEFIENPYDSPNLPEKLEVDVPFYGKRMVTKNHVISLQNDRGTEYQAYIDVQNELVAAYTELRNEISQEKFGKLFLDLDEEQAAAVQIIYKQNISEAEPQKYGEKK